jgi:hypothetical protein
MTAPIEKPGALSTEGKSNSPLVKSIISSHPGIDPSLIRKIYANDFTPSNASEAPNLQRSYLLPGQLPPSD